MCFSSRGSYPIWEILSDMRLTHLAVEFCVLKSEASNKEELICLYQKCWTIRGLQCHDCCDCDNYDTEESLMLSYFLSLNYCHLEYSEDLPTFVQLDVINNCKEVKYITVHCGYGRQLSLNVAAHNCNLQQLCINSPGTVIVDDFMTSVSAHGGLVHVVMVVEVLTGEGITSLMSNSPNLITLCLIVTALCHGDIDVETFNAKQKRLFCKRRLFTTGYYKVLDKAFNMTHVLWEQDTDLLPLWM